jgi:hypothetical protein
MAPPSFQKLIAQYPHILNERPYLSFSSKNTPAEASAEWDRSGAVMLRGVLSSATLERCRQTFHRFVNIVVKKRPEARLPQNDGVLTLDDGPSPEWDNGELDGGSWHLPWVIRHGGQSPTAIVLAELVGSWAWPFIEEICRSNDIVVMFGLSLGRHNIDTTLDVGVHQDAVAVNPDVPLSIWIPLHEVVPRRHSGLGFIVPSPGKVLPAPSHNDIGFDYFLEELNNVWVPRYRPGDLTIHSRYSPHFTTGYGTGTDRYSLEIRLWGRDDSLLNYLDPSIRIRRRNGVPVITETTCSLGIGAHGFLATTALLAMQAVSPASDVNEVPSLSNEATGPGRLLPRAVTEALRNAARRVVPGGSS